MENEIKKDPNVEDNNNPVNDPIIEDDSIDNETVEEPTVETDAGEETNKDYVPLKTHLTLKNQLKEARKLLESLEDKKYEEGVQHKKEAIRSKWREKGFDDDTSSMIADEFAQVFEDLAKAKQERKKTVLDEEIEDLSQDNFYSDINTYKDEIKRKIKSAEKLGETLSVEDAYLMTVGVRNKMKERQLFDEQKTGLSNNTKGKNNVPTATGSRSKNPYPLDEDDIKALEGLKKAQPGKNWTPEKYWKVMKE